MISYDETDFQAVARAAREAATHLAVATTEAKNQALALIARALRNNTEAIMTANQRDLDRGRENGISPTILDRLLLTPERLAAIADAVDAVVDLPDPVGEVVRGYSLPNGLAVRQVRVPFGVIGMIYEARPNVTVDAASLTLKSGNAVLLRGSSSAADSNRVLVDTIRTALADSQLPEDCVCLIPSVSHESVKELLGARGLVDVIIPRGGASLINSVVENATVPVIETGVGNCHLFVDETANLESALDIMLNSKVQRPSVCNSLETMLVHSSVADQFLPAALLALAEQGVTVHGDGRVVAAGREVGVAVLEATDDDWEREYLSLDLAVAVVSDVQAAVDHIRRWSSGHTEAIVSDSAQSIERFTAQVDSAAVIVNASTRFTDGSQFGFGAEIGISTQKLHARGPMGLPEMTSTKYVVFGDGQVRS